MAFNADEDLSIDPNFWFNHDSRHDKSTHVPNRQESFLENALNLHDEMCSQLDTSYGFKKIESNRIKIIF